jgi:hypothetical protein
MRAVGKLPTDSSRKAEESRGDVAERYMPVSGRQGPTDDKGQQTSGGGVQKQTTSYLCV